MLAVDVVGPIAAVAADPAFIVLAPAAVARLDRVSLAQPAPPAPSWATRVVPRAAVGLFDISSGRASPSRRRHDAHQSRHLLELSQCALRKNAMAGIAAAILSRPLGAGRARPPGSGFGCRAPPSAADETLLYARRASPSS